MKFPFWEFSLSLRPLLSEKALLTEKLIECPGGGAAFLLGDGADEVIGEIASSISPSETDFFGSEELVHEPEQSFGKSALTEQNITIVSFHETDPVSD